MSKKPEKDVSRETSGADSTVQNQPDSANAAPQPDKQENSAKPRRSAPVFIYLAILFAAAFLMLLLAYLVQQRNSENAIDDLRTSMTATREELMEQNRVLQEEKEALEDKNEELEAQIRELYGEIGELKEQQLEESGRYFEENKALSYSMSRWADLWKLEQSYSERDYDACAEFFRGAMVSNYYMTPPEAAERVEEIYNRLIDMGKLDEETPLPLVDE